MTHQRPDLFGIPVVPSTFLLVAGALLVCSGAWAYVRALHVLSRALAEGTLAVTGPFAHVRHPIYASWILLLLPGVALMLRSWLVLSSAVVGYLNFRLLIREEEAAMEARHGEDYHAYQSTHGRLFPAFRKKERGQ